MGAYLLFKLNLAGLWFWVRVVVFLLGGHDVSYNILRELIVF